jgi:hypothetical protein
VGLSALKSKGKLEPVDIAKIMLTQVETDTSAKTTILAETLEPFTIRGHGPRKISVDSRNLFHPYTASS